MIKDKASVACFSFINGKGIMREERIESEKYWNEIHEKNAGKPIVTDGWLADYDGIIENCFTPVIDLGCGSGNNTLHFLNKGKMVIACDQSEVAINLIRKNFQDVMGAECFNMLDGLPFEDDAYEIVCADLCLHYFSEEDTRAILAEIKRILTPGGYLFVRVNSVKDVNHGAGQGEEVEHHLYMTEDGRYKRFFDYDDIKRIFSDFKIQFCEEQKMGRYTLEKIVYSIVLRA